MLRQASVSKTRLVRDLSRESYWDFCQQFWHTVVPEKPIWNWHMEAIANALQKVCERIFLMKEKEYDLIINVPPGSSKSTLCSIMLLPWCWTRMPSMRFIGASYDHLLSNQLSGKARRLVKSDLYRACFPEIEISKEQDAKGLFANTKGGERIATSTGASIIGRHAHLHVVDDPLNPKAMASEADLTTCNDWLRESLSTRCIDMSITPRVLVMQRLGVEDPTATMLAQKSFPVKHYCFPAELSEIVKPKCYRKKYKKGLFDPVRYPKRVLLKKFEELRDYGYAGQFEQRPVPASGGMFKWQMFHIGPIPGPKEFDELVRFWDKAATKEGKGACSSGVLMGRLRDPNEKPRFWIIDVTRGRWDTHERERIIRQTAKLDHQKYKLKVITGMEQEPGSGGKDSVYYSLSGLAGYRCYAERPTGDKLERALPFCDQVNIGNVGLNQDGEWLSAYLEEMKFFGPTAKYMDQGDASSGCFNRLSRKQVHIGAGGF